MSLTAKEAFAKLPQKLHNFFIKYPPRPYREYDVKPSVITSATVNPFLPNKNPETGRWHGSKFSLRRSADLYKMARKFGIQDLLPPLPRKFYEEKYMNKNWMKGVLTQKKKKWERELDGKLEARKEAIENMDETIIEKRPRYRKLLEKREKRTWY
jgi:large subunit ribosomal protein L25